MALYTHSGLKKSKVVLGIVLSVLMITQSLGTGIFALKTAFAAGSTTTTTVVHASDLATGFPDAAAHPTKWFFYNDENDTIDNTLGSFVMGPATAPLGTGSAQISVTGTERRNLATYGFAGTKLADIRELDFSTYNPSAGNGGSSNRSAYLNFNVDFTGTSTTFQHRISYVPDQNGTVTQNNWKTWNAGGNGSGANPGNPSALYSYSGSTWPAPSAGPNIGVTGVSGDTLKTWAQILIDYPNIRILPSDGWLGLRVGEPYNDGYTENLDNFKIRIKDDTSIFDFEPTAQSTDAPCIVPVATSTGDVIHTFGASNGPEASLQQVLDTAYGTNAIVASTSDTGIQAWTIPTGTNSVTLSGKFVNAIASNRQAFGYYFDGDLSTFTPIFKTAAIHTASTTVLSPGDALPSTVIDTTGHTTIGFAIDTQGSFPGRYGTEKSVNGGDDHAVVYNNPNNSKGYVMAFEDLPFSPAGTSDKDYQDLIVEVNVDSCSGGSTCVASSGTVSSDITTNVTDIDGTSQNTPSVLVTPTSITNQYWTATTSDTNAKWIWSEDPVAGWTVDKTVTFTKTFTITGNPTAGSITIGADNTYDITLNGNSIGSDLTGSLATFGTAATYAIPANDFVTGSNNLVIKVKNLGQDGSALNNPAGLLYTLSWNSDCGNGGGGGPANTYQVHIAKYLDGVHADATNADSYAFPMTASYNYVDKNSQHQSGTGSYTLSPSGFGPADQTVPAYEANTDYMQSGAIYSTNEVTSDTDALSKVLDYDAECVPGDYILNGYGVSDTSFADAYAHVTTPANHGDHPNFNGVNHDEYIVVSNHLCTTPPAPTGTILITKYICPADTTVTRANNGVDGSAPETCSLESGATFGYVHGTQTDANSPYPELSAAITEGGTTAADGTLDITNLPADGRYLVVETDGSGHQLAASDILGLYCTGDGDTSGTNDNQELTFVQANATTSCVGYNKSAPNNDGGGSGTVDLGITKTVDNSNPDTDSNVVYTLTVTNNSSTATANNVVVTDTIPDGETYVSNDGSATFDSGTGILTWNIPTLTAGESTTTNVTVTVNAESGEIDNTATITSGIQGDSDSTNDSSTATLDVGTPIKLFTALGCGTNCNSTDGGGGSSGGGGGGFFAPRVLGASTNNPDGEVKGASTDLPNLPDTGNGSPSQTLATIVALFLALVALNTFALKGMKKS